MDSQGTIQGEHYNLRWNNYTSNLIQVFSELQHHETLVDVTLACEGQFIKAHKLILSACSAFFEDMFKIHSSFQHPVIVMNGIKCNYLKHILDFIYHGEVKILDKDLEGVLALGESFQVKGLSSVKIKHPDRPPSESSIPNSVYSKQGLLPSRRKQNDNNKRISSVSQQKSIVQLSKGVKKTFDNDRTNTQSIVGTHNGKEGLEPPVKRTRSLEVTKNALKENVEDSGKTGRPTSAFMLFANEWRSKLTVEYPVENNKEISVRLGNMWKSLSPEIKETYYQAASKAQDEQPQQKLPDAHTSQNATEKRKRRNTTDCLNKVDLVDTRQYDIDDDDDLQIIEFREDPIDMTRDPSL